MSRATKRLDRAGRKRLVERLNQDAARLAARYGLRFRQVEAERTGVKSRYGACFEDGTIKIRLVHAVTGAPLRYSSLVDTLCHELAHLKYWHHGPRFEAYYKRILAHARREGIYDPAPRAPRRATPPAMAARAASPSSDPSRRRDPREAVPPGATAVPAPSSGPKQLPLFGAAN